MPGPAVRVQRRRPGGLAVLADPGAGGVAGPAKAGSAVSLCIAAPAPASRDIGRRADREAVLLVGLAVDPANVDDVLGLVHRFQCIHRWTSPRVVVRRYAPPSR